MPTVKPGRCVVALACLGGAAVSQSSGPDPRLDYHEFPGNSPLRRVAEAVMFHYGRNHFVQRPDGAYDLAVAPRTNAGALGPLCPSVRFYGQPQATGGNTAALVGSRHVLLANHSLPANATAQSRAFVFGFQLEAPIPPGAPPPTAFTFAAQNVYFGQEIVARDPTNDWAVLRLDRDVPATRRPLVVRAVPAAIAGDAAVTIGFSEAIPLKGQSTSVVAAGLAAAVWSVSTDSLARLGASGSPLVGVRTGTIEGVLRSAVFPFVWDAACGGYVDDFAGAYGATSNFPLGAAALLPVIGLQAQPEHESVFDHYGPPGGPFTTTNLDLKLSCPVTSRAVEWRVAALEIDRIALVGSTPTPKKSLSGALLPGGSTSMTKQFLNIGAWTYAVGVHEARVQIEDAAYVTTSRHVHRFHAAVDGFDVAPATGIGTGTPGAPPDTVATYTLSNRHIVTQTLLIEPAAAWIRVNGAASASIPLPPSVGGVPGTGAAVIAFDVTGLAPGVYQSDVRFRPQLPAGFEDPPNPELVAQHRTVRIDVGRQLFASTDTPQGIPIPGASTVTVTVPPGVVVADLDLDLRVTAGIERALATITVRAPSGLSAVVHSISVGATEALDTILDDETRPPNQASLSTFDGVAAAGVWEVTVAATPNPPTASGSGSIERIVLRVTPQ